MRSTFAIVADLHIGQNMYGKFDPLTGVHTHSKVLLESIRQIIAQMKSRKIDDIFIVGDIFHRRNPTMTDWEVFNQVLQLFIENDIHVHLDPGNHDDSAVSVTSLTPLRLNPHPKIDFVQSMSTYVTDDSLIEIFFYSTVSKRWSNKSITEIISEVPDQKKTKYRICLCHEMINGAIANGTSFKSPLTPELLNRKFDLTIAGHVHQYQNVSGNVYYCGTPIHLDFGDRDCAVGFVIVDVAKTGDVCFWHVPISSRRYIQLEGTRDELIGKVQDSDEDIYKVKIRDTYENIKKFTEDVVKSHKGYIILEPFPLTKKEVARKAINTDLSNRDQLRSYLTEQKVDQETIDLGVKILEEVN